MNKSFALAVLGFVSVSSMGFAATAAAPVAAPAAPVAAPVTPAPAAICPTDNSKYQAALKSVIEAAAATRAANEKLKAAREEYKAALAAEISDNKAEQRVRGMRRAHMSAVFAAIHAASGFEGALASAQAQLSLVEKSGSVLSKEDLADVREERNELYRVVRVLNASKARAAGIEAALAKQNCKTVKPFAEQVTFDFAKLTGASDVISKIDAQLKELDKKAAPAVTPVVAPVVGAAPAPKA